MNAVRACALAFYGTSLVSGLWVGGACRGRHRCQARGGPTVFGTCVPTLVAENRSMETVDYLQVDLAMTLANGQERTVELQSAYREGVLYPIAPGAIATLKQPLDISRSLGVGCADITVRRVLRTICETAGKPCASPVRVQP